MVRDETLIFKGAVIGGLLLVFIFLLRDGIHSWQTEYLPRQPLVDAVRKGGERPGQEGIGLYPTPPAVMPDLHKGYLFDESRQAASEDDPGLGPAAEGVVGGVKFSDVSYSGSIIVGAEQRGIVSYPVAGGKQSRVPGKKTANKQLAVGDVFLDHEVVAILPDRIVFNLDGQPVEIALFDPAKQRFAVQPQKRTSRAKRGVVGHTKATGDKGAAKPAATASGTRRPPATERLRRQSANQPIPSGLRIPLGNTGGP